MNGPVAIHRREFLGVAAADHALDDPALVDALGSVRHHAPPVAEDGDRVRDRQDVVEEVGDEDDAAPAGAQPAQVFGQPEEPESIHARTMPASRRPCVSSS